MLDLSPAMTLSSPAITNNSHSRNVDPKMSIRLQCLVKLPVPGSRSVRTIDDGRRAAPGTESLEQATSQVTSQHMFVKKFAQCLCRHNIQRVTRAHRVLDILDTKFKAQLYLTFITRSCKNYCIHHTLIT